jgi:cholinesterase
VRDNIAKFGGDPRRIVLFGQAAGGVSVDYYSFAWRNDPIVAGFISESGPPAGERVTNATGSAFSEAAENLACGSSIYDSPADLIKCVRGKSLQSVLGAIKPPGGVPALGIGIFGPTVDNKVIFDNYPERRRKGEFVKKVKSPLRGGSLAHIS